MSLIPPRKAKKVEICDWCNSAGQFIDSYFDKFWQVQIERFLCLNRICAHEWTRSKSK